MRSVPLVVVLALVVSSSAQSQVAVPPRDVARPTATGTAAIRGRVVTQTGTPIRRALVTISEGPLRRQTTTDADGRYQFGELPAGRFSLNASRPGYLALQYGQKRPNQPGTPVVVANGQAVASIDFTLPRGGVITGRISDEFGEPLTQAQVQVGRLIYGPDGQRRAQSSQSTNTDDRGEFRAYGLMPGEYVVNAGVRSPVGPNAQGINARDVTEGFPAVFYPGTANADEAQVITVGVGEEISIQFSLIAARLSRVSGVVVDSSGRPAAGAQVQLMTRQGTNYQTMGGGAVAADGTFSVGGVPPGEHSIEVRPNNRPAAGAAQGEFASVPIAVAGGDISGLSIVTGRGATVTGRVVFEGNAPRAGGPSPMRVSSAPADPSRPQFGTGPANQNNGRVDADGNFQLAGLTGRLFFNVPVPAGWMLKSVTLEGEDITDRPLDLTGRGSVSGLTLTLTDRITEVSGQVTDDKGQPVTDATVIFLPAEPMEPMVASRWIRQTRPNMTTGRYQLRNLRPGRYVAVALDFLDQGRQFAPEFQQRLRQGAREFTVREAEPITVDLKLTSGL
jgi:protocatechuate 3,4-dioxygenase beta subunit